MKLGLLVLAAVLSLTGARGEVEDFRFRVEVLARGMAQPMQMAMAPDGRIFYNEIGGKLFLLDPKSREVKEVGRLEVENKQENGFIGMALDPDFAENHWLYAIHSPKDYDGQVVSRFEVREDRLVMESRKDLLQIPEQREQCCHHGGCLRFGPDGLLYISTGDNTNPFGSNGFTPIDEREGRSPWDAQKSSANTNDLRGKILRIRVTDEGGYEIPEGNLFPVGMEKTRPEIYAMGFRNPWRFTVDEKTGIVYTGDVGPDSGASKEERGPNGFDTINQIREPGYFGWPYSRGKQVYRDFDFAAESPKEVFNPEKPINDSPNNTGLRELPPVQSPMIWYRHKETAEFPLLGTGGRTACAGPVFHYRESFEESDGFPREFDGDLLIYDWQRPYILWAKLGEKAVFEGLAKFTGQVKVAQGPEEEGGPLKIRRPVDAFFGPDGCLYLADYGETWGANADSKIVKISYQRGNLAPKAVAAVTPAHGREPLEVTLSAEGSQDPEGGDLSYQWHRRKDGRLLGEGKEISARFTEPGDELVSLTVRDAQGAQAQAEVTVVVGNSAPEVRFVKPREGDFFSPGEEIAYEVEIVDAEDGKSTDAGKAAVMAGATSVSALWTKADGKKPKEETGMTLMKQSDCFNCHAIDQKLVGPTLLEIADKYRHESGALARAVERVSKGSNGVWGQIPMLPHPQHSPDEIHMMVKWIFSLEKGKAGPSLMRGLSGTVKVPKDGGLRGGLLEAGYSDFGRSPASSLPGKATVKLRSRTLEAELADALQGHNPRVLGGGKASGKRMVGSLSAGDALMFRQIPLTSSREAVLRVASAGKGGKIELRAGAVDGPKLGEVTVPVTGNWDTWVEVKTALQASSPGERGDLYLVCVGEGGGLFNIDFVRLVK